MQAARGNGKLPRPFCLILSRCSMSRVLRPPVPSAERPALRWHQLYGSAAALALSEALQADTRLYVVVADGARELERLSAELRFYGGDSLNLLTFPDWEVLPY